MNIKISLIVVSSIGLIFLGACSDNTVSTSTNSSISSPVEVAQSPSVSSKTDHPQESKGGQVIESGAYHLEFVL